MKKIKPIIRYRLFWIGTFLVALLPACSVNARSSKESQTFTAPESVAVTEDASKNDFSKIHQALKLIDSNLKQAASSTATSSAKTSFADQQVTEIGPKVIQENANILSSKKMGMTVGMGMEGMNRDMKMGMSGQGMQHGRMEMGKCKGMMCKMDMKNTPMMGQPPEGQSPDATDSETALPGYTSVPHLYHIGESEFFLDYSALLGLTKGQIDQLQAIQSQWQNQQDNMISQRDSLERHTWELTAMGKPDYKAIQKTVMSIESINAQLRLSFIRLVGQAVSVLTSQQVSKLTDTKL